MPNSSKSTCRSQKLPSRLDDQFSSVRAEATKALGALGGEQALPALCQVLKDPNEAVRKATILALGILGDKRVVPDLLQALKHSDDDMVGIMTISVLRKFVDEKAVPGLLKLLTYVDGTVRGLVIRLLGDLGDTQVVPVLFGILEDSHDNNRSDAIEALGHFGDKNALTKCLIHENSYVRKTAIRELVQLRGEFIESHLLSCQYDGVGPWIDPSVPITKERILETA